MAFVVSRSGSMGVRGLGDLATGGIEKVRYEGLDRLRGLAVLLMLLDHILLVTNSGPVGDVLRNTVTRAALPLFCIVFGALAPEGIGWKRLLVLIAWGAIATLLGSPLGIGQPDILWVLGISAALMGAGEVCLPYLWPNCPVRPWMLLMVLAILQPTTWPARGNGYELGTVLALMLLGRLVGVGYLHGLGARLPGWLAVPGRAALWWYVGHLAALCLFVWGWITWVS